MHTTKSPGVMVSHSFNAWLSSLQSFLFVSLGVASYLVYGSFLCISSALFGVKLGGRQPYFKLASVSAPFYTSRFLWEYKRNK